MYRWAVDFAANEKVDYFIFGHYHAPVDLTLPDGARLMVLKDWMESSPYFLFDGAEVLTCLT